MKTALCSCLGLLQQGIETMAGRLLVLVSHGQTHVSRSILQQVRELDPDLTEIGAIAAADDLRSCCSGPFL